jgi:glucose/arabinose dehydrogenase
MGSQVTGRDLSVVGTLRKRIGAVGLALVMSLTTSCINPAPPEVEAQEFRGVRAETFARGLTFPWAMAFLPDGRMLVTEREGRLRLISASGVVSPPLAGVPEVDDRAYNGLLDIVLDPAFRRNRRVYFTFSEPRADGVAIAVARATLGEAGLENVEIIFRQMPAYDYAAHNGARLLFGAGGSLYATLGDRNRSSTAQALGTHNGKIVRLTAAGAAAANNPFAGRADARPQIWATGLRNSQGIALRPGTREIWAVDHGPRGGDELNLIDRGGNYGWPLESAGAYEPDEAPTRALRQEAAANPQTLLAPVRTWTPSIAPSSLEFYTGDKFPQWRGDLFISGLEGKALIRLKLDGVRVVAEERLLRDFNERMRQVRQGPDGLIYVLTDAAEARILRLVPRNGPDPSPQ